MSTQLRCRSSQRYGVSDQLIKDAAEARQDMTLARFCSGLHFVLLSIWLLPTPQHRGYRLKHMSPAEIKQNAADNAFPSGMSGQTGCLCTRRPFRARYCHRGGGRIGCCRCAKGLGGPYICWRLASPAISGPPEISDMLRRCMPGCWPGCCRGGMTNAPGAAGPYLACCMPGWTYDPACI